MSLRSKQKYTPLGPASTIPEEEKGEEDEEEDNIALSELSSDGLDPEAHRRFVRPRRNRFHLISSWILKSVALAVLLVFVFETWEAIGHLQERLQGHDHEGHEAEVCTSPAVRPSWNDLKREEKLAYITAVRCMAEVPSYMNPNSTVYDDHTYIHVVYGNLVHLAAEDLPWHRLHLHAWELRLRRECGYKGHLPYWAWEEEYPSVRNSSVFDNEMGFGGDGDQSEGPLADENSHHLDDTRCIRNGPFVELQPQWFAELPDQLLARLEYRPHCITRSFTGLLDPKVAAAEATHLDFGPMKIEELMEMKDYSSFSIAVQGVHDWLPLAMRGDFASLSAPNDPLFYLHLANIDRLWWQWQRQDRARATAYNGMAMRGLNVTANLDDPLPYSAYPALYRPVRVRDMMDTQSGAFAMCYRY